MASISKSEPVQVTGLGCLSAAGPDLETALTTLERGERDPRPSTLFQTERQRPVFSCVLLPRDTWPEIAKEANACSRTVLLALAAAQEALNHAGFTPETLAGLRVGVCLGTSVGASLNFFETYRANRKRDADSDNAAPDLAQIHVYARSNPAPALARMLRLNGPVQTVVNACSSGADAIGQGCRWIRQGLCDVVLAGGADALDQVTAMGFDSLLITSPEPCAPFDANRKGLNLGEGAGILVLESAASLLRRQAPSRGQILGYGTATDAHHLTAPHPEARGLSLALDQALAQAGVSKDDIGFINAHGTATPANDASEGRFFHRCFPGTPFFSTKGCTGHTLGAAGAVEAAFTLAHLIKNRIPASPGFQVEDPEIGVSPTTRSLSPGADIALSQSLAFGGNNSVLLLRRGEAL